MSGRSAHALMIRALLARGGETCRLVEDRERDWCSLTFEGTRHVVGLMIAADAADAFLHGIEEADFALRGHVVADLAVAGRAPTVDGIVHVRLEALTLIDAGSLPERTAGTPRLRGHG